MQCTSGAEPETQHAETASPSPEGGMHCTARGGHGTLGGAHVAHPSCASSFCFLQLGVDMDSTRQDREVLAGACCGSELSGCKQAHGLRECALGGGGGQPRVPPWLEKWTALILKFIEEEQSLLPSQLLSLRLPAPSFAPLYTPAGAVSEARGMFRLAA